MGTEEVTRKDGQVDAIFDTFDCTEPEKAQLQLVVSTLHKSKIDFFLCVNQ